MTATDPLEEAKYSADQLRAMLAKGHAIRNDQGEPSYPIGDTEDLAKAIRAVGRGGAGHDKIRAYIIRRAKALGASDKIPDGWSKSGSSSGASEAATLAESTTLAEATRGQQPTGSRMRIKLIDAGWGSSGYYSPQVLREAAANGVFPVGTQMYLDHPSMTEAVDRPERSVKDLAAVLVTPATYADGALYAEARVFAPYQWLAEKKDAIGVSIRAAGTAEPGEAEGRQGMLITSLTEGLSVDFVTRAGRGGQIVELLESARAELREGRSIGAWLESRIHLMFTQFADDMYGCGQLNRDERITLSSAIGNALDTFTSAVEQNAPQLYDRDLWDEPPEPGDADVSESRKPPVGAPPPGNHPLNEGKQMSGTNTGAPNGGGTDKPTNITEADVASLRRQLAEAEERLQVRSDAAVRLEEAERDNARLRDEVARFRALESARSTVAAALAESGLPETAFPRVTAAVVGHEGATLPMTEAGAVDGDKLKAAIEAAIKAEKTYVAGLLEAAGVGAVRGLGESADGGYSDEDADKELAEAMKGLGMSETATKIAVTGRG